MPETFAEEVARLRREIAERQLRLQHLIMGDPCQGVALAATWDQLGPMPRNPALEAKLANVKFA